MPELPEVETVRRHLLPSLEGKWIAGSRLRLPRIFLGKRSALARLTGQRILRLRRRGKYLALELDQDALVFHLGMTGALLLIPAAEPAGRSGPHVRFSLELEGGNQLVFRDPRTFGRVILVPGGDWEKHPRAAKLGPEPLEISAAEFLPMYPSDSARNIKSTLLDQSFLAGVGNIYADESLFRAGVRPTRPARRLSVDERRQLLAHLKKILSASIARMGTTFSDFRHPDGGWGEFHRFLRVYGRGGMPCTKCRTILVKTVVAGRGTVYCPRCQK